MKCKLQAIFASLKLSSDYFVMPQICQTILSAELAAV